MSREDTISRFTAKEGFESIHSTSGEASFGKSPCECCGDALAGDRHGMTGLFSINGEKTVTWAYEVCTECLFAIEGIPLET